MNRKQIVLIDWEDSNSLPGWHHSEDLGGRVGLCQSAGFFVSEDDKQITLALNREYSGMNYPYGDLISIPKSAIKSKKILYTFKHAHT